MNLNQDVDQAGLYVSSNTGEPSRLMGVRYPHRYVELLIEHGVGVGVLTA